MPKYSLELPEAAIAFLEEKALSGGFAGPGDYICTLLQEVVDRDWKQEVKEKVREAESEPAAELTADDWEQLRRRVYERHPEVTNPASVSP
jgi:Arc/MetJ-type ribon-helix-helix transcriptional regulator